jgi:hypothetical protein
MTIYTRYAALLLLSITGLFACGQDQAGPATVTDTARPPWAEFATMAVAEYYRHRPERAVGAGLHQYDGQISDLSPESVIEYLAWVKKTRSEAETYDDLEGMEAFERDYLVVSMNEEEFNFETADYMSRNPAAYVSQLGFSVYLDREYAPLDVRMRGYTQYVAQFPAYFETMRSNLQPPLAKPFIEMSLARFGGLVGYLETTVPEIFSSVEAKACVRPLMMISPWARSASWRCCGPPKAWKLRWQSSKLRANGTLSVTWRFWMGRAPSLRRAGAFRSVCGESRTRNPRADPLLEHAPSFLDYASSLKNKNSSRFLEQKKRWSTRRRRIAGQIPPI